MSHPQPYQTEPWSNVRYGRIYLIMWIETPRSGQDFVESLKEARLSQKKQVHFQGHGCCKTDFPITSINIQQFNS